MKIKIALKNKMNTGKPINFEKIMTQIRNYSIVSFDIFDTLLKRNVYEPKDVFVYIETILQNRYPNFTEKRLFAEKTAREKNKGHEVSLHDIYNEYEGINSREISELMELELMAEEQLLIVNNDILQVYKKCIEQGKIVILISDMYLPESFITHILAREGITGYKKLYLSSTLDKTKSLGNLFSYAINDLAVDNNKLIHIGDSIRSDYKKPKSMGIEAIHISTNIPKSAFHLDNSNIAHIMLNAFLDNTSPIQDDHYYRFGYEKFGMFLWGYSNWLHKKLLDNNIEKVYFFSRDGLIMKKAFDLLYHDEHITTHYLEVSRRSLRVPILWIDHKLSTVIDMISPSMYLPLRTIFDGVGLEINDYVELIKKYGFDENTSFDRKTVLEEKNLIKLYDELSADVVQVSKAEYEILIQYLKQNHIEGEFAIVDIGWSGGMQRYLDETLSKLNISHKISGYYIGIAQYYIRNIKAVPSLNLNGYLFDFKNDHNAVDKRSAFVGLFETLFLEQNGSVQKYERNGDQIKAKRLPYEYIEDGKFTEEYICVEKIQQGAMDFIKKISNYEIFNLLNFTADELFKGLKQTGLNPNKLDLKLFANFRFFDDGETRYLATPRKLIYYFFHIKTFKEDFLMSRWKIGYMKRLFKININYNKLYELIRIFK